MDEPIEFTNRAVALVSLVDMYIYYYIDDHAFSYALTDSRAKVINKTQIEHKWEFGSISYQDAWNRKGMGIFSLVSLHYWKNDIDFCYLDIGANYGMTTIGQALFYKRCGRTNFTYAFEPGDIFPLLQESVYVNRIDNIVKCVKLAASDRRGKVTFYVTPKQSPASSLLSSAVHRRGVVEVRSTQVEAVRIDDFVAGISETSGMLVKIDAEGADLKVLDGMVATQYKKLCTFQIELFPLLTSEYTNVFQRISSLLRDFHIVDTGSFKGEIVNKGSLKGYIERVSTTPIRSSDILMIPKRLIGAGRLVDRIKNNFD